MRGNKTSYSTAMKSRPGFTMVELLVAMGLASLVLAGMVTLFSTSNQAYVDQDRVVAVEQNIRASMEIMAYELRMAGYIPLSNLSGGSAAVTSDVSGQSWSDGTFERLEETGTNSITFSADINADDYSETIRYYESGGDLMRQSWTWDGANWQTQAGGTAVTLAENITGLQFTYVFSDGSTGTPNDSDANTDNDRDDVRSIIMMVSGQTSVESRIQHNEKALQSTVNLRNMGLNTSVN